MKHFNRRMTLGVSLVVLSTAAYFVHYLVFRDPHHIFIYLVGDLAFVFIEVLLVTLIIHRLLEERDKMARMEKVNMVIGAFFSEVGTGLLMIMSKADPMMEDRQRDLAELAGSADQDLGKLARLLRTHNYSIDGDKIDWALLSKFLSDKRNFMLRLLENPNVLEHESFTNVLRAVFHLTEELGYRTALADPPEADRRHLAGDASRVYGQLARQWLAYMEYLKKSYPYLLSLALRTNPFNWSSSAVVREGP